MKTIFLDNELMSILAEIRTGKKEDEKYTESKVKKLKEALNKHIDTKTELDEMTRILIETYLKSFTRVVISYHKKDQIVKRGYYFYDDLIVMLNAYRDGGELMWIPSAKMLMGTIAELIDKNICECENEEFEGEFGNYCNEINDIEKLIEGVREDKYRLVLQKEKEDVSYLWLKGSSALEENKCFIYVILGEQGNYYYFRQEENKFLYGTANYSTIVNILGKWMISQHRNLIIQMQQEE